MQAAMNQEIISASSLTYEGAVGWPAYSTPASGQGAGLCHPGRDRTPLGAGAYRVENSGDQHSRAGPYWRGRPARWTLVAPGDRMTADFGDFGCVDAVLEPGHAPARSVT